MNQFELHRFLYGERITAQVLRLAEGVHISIFGGNRPHIGAVSTADPEGVCHTIQFSGHRDGAVSEKWINALVDAGYCPAVVEAGIHYDHLDKQGIAGVLALSDEMLADVMRRLSDRNL